MKIKELKELIADLPDDMEVLTPGFDHSYYSVCASCEFAEKNGRNLWSEWYEDCSEGKAIAVFVVGP